MWNNLGFGSVVFFKWDEVFFGYMIVFYVKLFYCFSVFFFLLLEIIDFIIMVGFFGNGLCVVVRWSKLLFFDRFEFYFV